MKSSNKKLGKCRICGERSAIDKDHIPPKNLFALADRINLLRIPACEECNSQYSKDDEYFKRILLMSAKIENETPSIIELREHLTRSFNNPKQSKFNIRFAKSISIKNIFTSSGLYLGREPVYFADYDRLNKILDKIIRGLFYYHERKILQKDYLIKSFTEEDLLKSSLKARESVRKTIIAPLNSTILNELGKNTFKYRFRLTNLDKREGAWMLNFYSKITFLSIVLHKSRFPLGETSNIIKW
jgi:hypothetical protein